ncbi:hypothetical protein KIN20_001166 [Parelaphostrongylus tenuis]|uniref:Uncharacterized protein n=1 Tax=Parelaphostrongylus tenuis TaxID=148309 RepID=A0AAD5QGR9_PARTN|nr:hypothetical protein KIN20_001166 [Parelaphostrongylus tenuis]
MVKSSEALEASQTLVPPIVKFFVSVATLSPWFHNQWHPISSTVTSAATNDTNTALSSPLNISKMLAQLADEYKPPSLKRNTSNDTTYFLEIGKTSSLRNRPQLTCCDYCLLDEDLLEEVEILNYRTTNLNNAQIVTTLH